MAAELNTELLRIAVGFGCFFTLTSGPKPDGDLHCCKLDA